MAASYRRLNGKINRAQQLRVSRGGAGFSAAAEEIAEKHSFTWLYRQESRPDASRLLPRLKPREHGRSYQGPEGSCSFRLARPAPDSEA